MKQAKYWTAVLLAMVMVSSASLVLALGIAKLLMGNL